MKTEDWTSLLARGIEPVNPWATRRYWLAVPGGFLGSLAITGGMLHFNRMLARELLEPMFWVREGFCVSLGLLALIGMARLARPGRVLGRVPAGIAGILFGIWIWSIADLLLAPADQRASLWLGTTAAVCPFLIALVAAPLLVAMLWILRGLAPTRLRLAGAVAGFAAGSLGALAYSLHCPELTIPFVATWYFLGILIPTALGAWCGPRVLRW